MKLIEQIRLTYCRNRKIGWTSVLLAMILSASLSFSPYRVWAEDVDLPEAEISVGEMSDRSVLVTFRSTGYAIDVVESAGGAYHEVIMPGTVNRKVAGAPVTPALGVVLGVPTLEGLTLTIVDTNYEEIHEYHLYPAPAQAFSSIETEGLRNPTTSPEFVPDPHIYAQDQFYPYQIAEMPVTGMVREQAVAQVLFRPVQYNPVRGTVRIYSRIAVLIAWDEAVQSADYLRASPAYERVLRHALLNYEELARPTPSWPGADDASTQAAMQIATGQSLKIGVNADGFYQLTRTDLVQSGYDVEGVDPRTFKMRNKGVEVPILVRGENDGSFDTGDSIRFYGQGIDDIYTDENVYWLSSGGELGDRMGARNATPASGDSIPQRFPAQMYAEENNEYWIAMPNGEGEDHWFWHGRIGPGTSGIENSRAYTVSLDHIATGVSDATVRVRLKGYTTLGHRTKISLNGTVVDVQSWEGQIVFDHEVQVDHALLAEGANVIKVEAADAGASVDQIYVNWIEIDYFDTYVAEENMLVFRAPRAGRYRLRVSGFEEGAISVFDITDPAAPQVLVGAEIEQVGDRYHVTVGDSASDTTRYVALTESAFRRPARVVVDEPSNWKSSQNGADYILVTHADFYSNTMPLADHRKDSGLRVAVVKVEDLYDEFNDGIFNPEAIRSFLSYAYKNWQAPAPTYILLIGDAAQDYRDRLGTGTANYVPSQIYETENYGETISDSWFVSIVGNDALPDMIMGRLSADSPDQVDVMVDKIIGYEQNPPDASWSSDVLFVVDDDTITFEIASDRIIDQIPFYYTASTVLATNYPPSTPADDIRKHFDQGSVFVNYTGHGDVRRWGRWGQEGKFIWDTGRIAELSDGGPLSFVTIANCLNGYFGGSKQNVSLAEELQRVDGKGAVAVFAPTGFGSVGGQHTLLSEVYRSIFYYDLREVGAATTAAEISAVAVSEPYEELIATYALFGDPATHLGIPTNYPYVERTSPKPGAEAVPLDEPIRVIFSKPVDKTSVRLSDDNGAALQAVPSWNASNTVVTFSHKKFEAGKTYRLSVTGTDMSGVSLGPGPASAPIPWSFVAASDTTAPTATVDVQQAPQAGGTQVLIRVEFSEPMRTQSVAHALVPHVAASLQWEASAEAATIGPTDDFVPGVTYAFSVTAGVDLAGNSLLAPPSTVFTVEEPIHVTYLPRVSGRQ